MDIIFLVVDSLRAHPFSEGRVGNTPFLDALHERALEFSRAYATECWTLPSHASMFTGQMPSEHGAHFHEMAYRGTAPTLAERLADCGYETESITRNFVFDGTIPGINRGFARRTAILSDAVSWEPSAVFLALAKPRFRRHLRNTGFFHSLHRGDRRFIETFARALRPADDRLLTYLVDRAKTLRCEKRRFFLFANLYDVHAPYAPATDSLLRSWRSVEGVLENLLTPYALSRLGEHRYLQRGFGVSERVRSMLVRRYRRSVDLMDKKLAHFFSRLEAESLLDDTLVVLTSDHGEGFGEHGLFLHDASLYETHLHVPLWVMSPGGEGGRIDEVVSTRHLSGLVERLCASGASETILDPEFRARHPVAYAQHFHYPRLRDPLPIYRSNQFAAISRDLKVIRRGARTELFELGGDSDELRPIEVGWRDGLDAVVGGTDVPDALSTQTALVADLYAAAAA